MAPPLVVFVNFSSNADVVVVVVVVVFVVVVVVVVCLHRTVKPFASSRSKYLVFIGFSKFCSAKVDGIY